MDGGLDDYTGSSTPLAMGQANFCLNSYGLLRVVPLPGRRGVGFTSLNIGV